jgi:hypothetical protein
MTPPSPPRDKQAPLLSAEKIPRIIPPPLLFSLPSLFMRDKPCSTHGITHVANHLDEHRRQASGGFNAFHSRALGDAPGSRLGKRVSAFSGGISRRAERAGTLTRLPRLPHRRLGKQDFHAPLSEIPVDSSIRIDRLDQRPRFAANSL